MSENYDYNYHDLLESYSRLGVSEGKLIFVSSDLIRLMRFSEKGREFLLGSHLAALKELTGTSGTIIVPTASLNLCNTDVVFDVYKTPSSDMGVFSEYVRKQDDAYRSFHPFWSVAGIGRRAKELLSNISPHGYGIGSIWQKLVENDALGLNIGVHPRFAVPVIHHIETVVGVPYRYTKEFVHPVFRNGKVEKEPYYLSVTYKDCDIVRDRNRKIFDNYEKEGNLRTEPIGKRGSGWSFSFAQFYEVTSKLLIDDIYSWLEAPPEKRPYQE